MPLTGSGSGTPIVAPTLPSVVYDQMEELVTTPNCAVSLARYAKLINYEEASFWGVIWENQYLRGCDPLWSEYQRMSIGNALAEAQEMIEGVLGYPLCPTYISGVYNDNPRWFDQQLLKSPTLITRYPRILAFGTRASTEIETDSEIDYDLTAGIGTVGPLATDATDVSEIKIFYPGSDRQITPSKITLSGGNVTIEIPKYRMVKQEFLNDNGDSIRYENINFFLSEVDVYRIYTDTTQQATLVRPNCRNASCVAGCYECTQSACVYVHDPFLGKIQVTPATWNEDTETWNTQAFCGPGYSAVRLNYLAGLKTLNLQAEMTIVRFAHALMGRPPCQCDKTGQMWQKDYEVTGAVTRERINCPFGLSNGAWNAYRWALSMASKRASIF